jgi:hypothetical protein
MILQISMGQMMRNFDKASRISKRMTCIAGYGISGGFEQNDNHR